MNTKKMPSWLPFVFVILLLSFGLYLLSKADDKPPTWLLPAIGFATVVAIIIFLAVKLKWKGWKKVASWKWSKISTNWTTFATGLLFLGFMFFLTMKGTEIWFNIFETYPEVQELQDKKFKERQAMIESEPPKPVNFKLDEWATYHKDSVYYYRRGMGIALKYHSADPNVKVIYKRISNPKVTTSSSHENGAPKRDLTHDDGAGLADWAFTVSNTCQMQWFAEENQ